MSILIAFLGGMLTLLSPCTLPVIPLLFASVRAAGGSWRSCWQEWR
ncbi:cytochrome c biogenesis protein/redoxin [Klebsiella pneumoniae]|uniref:Cytochrome c biogenesis protein/redoxin n=2 Tax=Klebsiella pneumoniae TaxID=573 RepID=A0A377ZKX7_KLEPO|nr:cytochrome c biogenesis protein/redoxin [Klebsiella pneumoniae]STU74856.1 cytochrome c biogenesis protein/redoxin [Klebsiella pneumoniae subsp. ozaenae]STV60287.1 cytochrome c biogenesis protein/redoxin [Klebsiella pneumoniae]